MPTPGKKFPTYWCRITSWRGLCPGAVHYYATIRTPNTKQVRLTHKLSKEEADSLNHTDGYSPAPTRKEGDTSEVFFTEEQAVREAERYIWSLGIHTSTGILNGLHAFLIIGDHCCADPQEVRAAPEGVYEVARRLYEEGEGKFSTFLRSRSISDSTRGSSVMGAWPVATRRACACGQSDADAPGVGRA